MVACPVFLGCYEEGKLRSGTRGNQKIATMLPQMWFRRKLDTTFGEGSAARMLLALRHEGVHEDSIPSKVFRMDMTPFANKKKQQTKNGYMQFFERYQHFGSRAGIVFTRYVPTRLKYTRCFLRISVCTFVHACRGLGHRCWSCYQD